MSVKKISVLLLILPLVFILKAQPGDARYKKQVDYNFNVPKEYTIKNILVTGNKNIQSAVVIIYSGLSINQNIKVPGNDLPLAIQNLWKQDFFSDIQVFIKEIDSVNVNVLLQVKEQPRLKRYRFVDKNNRPLPDVQAKALKDEAGLKGGSYISNNLQKRTIARLNHHLQEKGYYDASVNIIRHKYVDPKTKDTLSGYEEFEVVVERGKKVKVYDFDFTGNQVMTDPQLRHAIKKIKRRKNKINLLVTSKYIEEKFSDEKDRIIKKYQVKGYRDVRIEGTEVKIIAPNRVTVSLKLYEGKKYYLGNIHWTGNTKYRNGQLDTILGLKKGDAFNYALLKERLFSNPGGFDVQSLYMDDGYLFFNMQMVETGVIGDSIDVEVRMNEGPQARVAKVTWEGNSKTSDKVILREIRTKPGDIFSRSEIQRTMRDLAALNLFNPEKFNVNPKPNPADGTVDIHYILEEKPSDQIELSGGWGGSGYSSTPTLIGTAGVTLNNFSTRKIFKPRLWNPVPTGDGQKLTLRAQSNGSSYESYNSSFTEPWFGGKKPNSFSVSVFHNVNKYDYLTRKDPNRKVFFNTGVNLMLGKRLKWPDDFFSIQYVLSLQRYRFQNLGGSSTDVFGFPKGFDGIAYNPSVSIILSRSSVSDPIFPTSGSTITFSGQATPPFSYMTSKDISTLPLSQKYRFAEFYKFKFDAEWYTPITKKLVLMNKARFGYLGAYNSKLGVTFFERFQVGGSGMYGFNLAATEIISQRGYENYSISKNAMGSSTGAPIYNKFTSELRYAITTGQTATVYGLVFAEAGNAYSSAKKYNPFQLNRAVGVGVRLFMPMFGLIGLDYGYGFDYKNVTENNQPGRIHFFIGQQF